MKIKYRDTLHIDFSDYNIYKPTEEHAVANSIYALSASLIAKYLDRGGNADTTVKMPDDLLRLRDILRDMWINPKDFITLQSGDKAAIETSLLTYCEDWIDLWTYEKDARYNKIQDVIYYSNTLFAKIFLRPMHHEAVRSKIITDMIAKPETIKKQIDDENKKIRKKAEAEAEQKEVADRQYLELNSEEIEDGVVKKPRRKKKKIEIDDKDKFKFTPLEILWHKHFRSPYAPPEQ